MKYYIIAGEASGDLHGSNLMKGLYNVDEEADIRFWGGDKMAAVGGKMVKHYKDADFMGFVEVLMNLGKVSSNLKACKEDILFAQPDVLILIDYPGFNLRIAEFAKKHHIKVFYYISPKIWAWKESRIKKIKAFVDKMFVIFPFEIDFYKKHGMEVDFAGNPLLDAICQKMKEDQDRNDFVHKNSLNDKPIIALLAGSRRQEIEKNLPLMLEMIPEFPDYQFVLAAAPSIDKDYYSKFLTGTTAKIVFDQTYDCLKHARAALVTSGTAALETALFNVPQVVCYKANPISYHIIRQFIKVKYISLVNLIMDAPVVKEFIQKDMNKATLKAELDSLLHDKAYRQKMLDNYNELKEILGGTGASIRVAKKMHEYLKVDKSKR